MAAFSASSHLKSVKGNARMTSMRPKRNMKKNSRKRDFIPTWLKLLVKEYVIFHE